MDDRIGEDISTIWTRFYIQITNVRNHLERDRSLGNAADLHIECLPELSADADQLVELLIHDSQRKTASSSGLHRGLRLSMEYFLHNNVAEDLTRFAQSNVPEGLRELVVGMFTRLLASLPPTDFLQERLSVAVTTLIKLASRECKSSSSLAASSLNLLVALNLQLLRFPPLRKVFVCDLDTPSAISTILCVLMQNEEFSGSNEFRELLLYSFKSELLGDDAESYDDLLISLVCSLIRAFSFADFEESERTLLLLDRITSTCSVYSNLSIRLTSIYRELFVEKVFCNYLLGNGDSRGCATRVLDLLVALSRSLENSVIFIPLFSRAIRVFEKLALETSPQIIFLYCHALQSESLRYCFPMKKSSRWTDSVSNHRSRIEKILSLLPLLQLDCFRDVSQLSEVYKRHLVWAENPFNFSPTFPSEFTGRIHSSSSGEKSRRDTALDPEKNRILWSLFAKCKVALSLFWESDFESNFMHLRFLIWMTSMLDSPDLYSEYQDSTDNLVGIIARLVKDRPRMVVHKNHLLEPLIRAHVEHDVFHGSAWQDLHIDLGRKKGIPPYILGHFLLRLAALIQVKAMERGVTIVYT